MGTCVRASGLLLAAALVASCGKAAAPAAEPVTRNYVSIYGSGEALQPSSVDSSSARTASSGYSVYGVNRAVDGDTNTEWANEGWRDRQAWLSLSFDRVMNFDSVEIKTGPLQHSHYVLETSVDGYDWRPASGPLKNHSWQMETKAVNGRGRYLRVHWYNDDDPRGYFAIFEVQAFGRPTGTYSLQRPDRPSYDGRRGFDQD
ncbi:MAG: sialidase [Cyanobacteria bacterium RYN_339]|nr:sialidase [Cyanobacteria bacterium RYN_339]